MFSQPSRLIIFASGFAILKVEVPKPKEVPNSKMVDGLKYATTLNNRLALFFEIPAILAILAIFLELFLNILEPFPKSLTVTELVFLR